MTGFFMECNTEMKWGNFADFACRVQIGQSIQEWTKLNLWKTAFKKFQALQIFWILSFTNFTWSVLEYFAPIKHHLEN